MQSQLVFQEEKERERLRRQNLLLSQAEKPALEHFFKGKSELSVLDIGCNDGARTFHRFSDDRISRVIGLEYNQQLVERANSQFGNTKFSFYQMDVDRDSFSADFQKLCTEPEDREFDLICLSFVLMHLHDGEKLLRTLKNFLKKGGLLAFEIGYNQGESVRGLMQNDFYDTEVIKDLNDNDRVVIGKLK